MYKMYTKMYILTHLYVNAKKNAMSVNKRL